MVSRADEFNQYFTRGYCPLLLNGNEFALLFATRACNRRGVRAEMDGDVEGTMFRRSPTGKWLSEAIERLSINYVIDHMLKVPASGVFIKVGPTATYAEIPPARQFAKSLHMSRFRFHTPNALEVSEILGIPIEELVIQEERDTLWKIFNPEFSRVSEAVSKLQDGTAAGEPLSNNFAVVATRTSRQPVLVYKDEICGTLDRFNRPSFEEEYSGLVDLYDQEVLQ